MAADPEPAGELAGIFARMSGFLLTEATVSAALARVTTLAVDTIPGSTGAGVSLLDAHGKRITSAATDPLAERLDELQYQLDEGPCLSAWRDLTVLRSEGTEEERRWPSWIKSARQLGMRSFVSAPLISGQSAIGAIKVYSTGAAEFSEHDADLLRRFGDEAAIFVANVQTRQAAEQLSAALKETLRSREVIATARGILMARRGLDSVAAFRELAAESRRTGRLMHDVAARMVAAPGDV